MPTQPPPLETSQRAALSVELELRWPIGNGTPTTLGANSNQASTACKRREVQTVFALILQQANTVLREAQTLCKSGKGGLSRHRYAVYTNPVRLPPAIGRCTGMGRGGKATRLLLV